MHLSRSPVAVLLIIGGCSGGGESPPAAARDPQAVPDSAPTAMVDHSAHIAHDSAAGAEAPQPGMAGMDHSAMPGMVGSGAPPAHAAAGHAPAASAGTAGAQGHEGHAAATPAAAAPDHAAMGHQAAPPAPSPTPAADEGTEKLLRLGRELVRDSVVQRRIQQDPALREAWSDPEVRAIVAEPAP
jgi:hypothetical protein